jgi:hypothetical protein
MELIKAYNWYNYIMHRSDAMEFLIDYYKARDPKMVKKIRATSEKMFDTSICWTARLVDRGWNVPKHVVDKIDPHVKMIVARYADLEKKTDGVVIPLIDRAKEKEGIIIGDIEEMLDRDEPLNIYQWLTANTIPKHYANKIIAYYEPIVAELRESYESPDDDLKEGYRHLSKAGKRKLLEKYESIISDADRYAENKKVERTPRKKKAVPIEKKISNVQYMPRFDEYQLVSLKPNVIPGAKELWIYDARYKDVIHYVASEGGFDVRGTTLINFDEKLSVKKSAGRRSKEYADRIMKDSKIQLRKLMDDIKAPPREPNGRLNHNMLFLKVVS